MALLSTLRPLPQRLLERLWWILSGYVPTSIEWPMTLDALNDDCLLILLDTLTMSQLLQLRGVSRRFCHLIERHSLRKFKTLIFNCAKKKKLTDEGIIEEYFESRKDTDRKFGAVYFWHLGKYFFPASKLVPLRSNAWPLSLPLLLPRLSSLTLEHFPRPILKSPTKEHLTVNRRFVTYLNSNWSRTLTTLHLHIHGPTQPQPDDASFAQLNHLINLKHLYLDFLRLPNEPESHNFLLPDSMPILGQLLSFSLLDYADSNTATLLHQLGPDLSLLSLRKVTCTEDDYVAFLRARPNYSRTLKTLNVSLYNSSWKLFTEATKRLSSLKEFVLSEQKWPKTELHTTFTHLSHLKQLEYIYSITLFVDQLRLLRRCEHIPGTLPRLTSILVAGVKIYNFERNADPFQPDELFDQLLPPLSKVFGSLVSLQIIFIQGYGQRRDDALSEQLSAKLRQFFPTVKSFTAVYLVE